MVSVISTHGPIDRLSLSTENDFRDNPSNAGMNHIVR